MRQLTWERLDWVMFNLLLMSYNTENWLWYRDGYLALKDIRDEIERKEQQGQESQAMGSQAVAGLAANRSY